ncbi:hypothetical protein AVEN_173955-1 [Araneus ventricosus]|uniref:Uncharacterized protein n=1 Tax=Araneus ventricosus TaxID=182803 RepID=A0A4Y2NWC5_ARAVE|nr:hypothetical protein AVEN_69558-1 [Araneus ventricosus]GBN42999.1 hypothetical protein AVEN_94064-1 [Araneus ventricosus]GBN44412.1 hypothetical protein AVEN_173955-1 [Araneus ventricosus]
MKQFDLKYARKQETDDEKEENVILMKESVDEDFGSFQQETEAAEMEEVIYLESSKADFSTTMYALIDNNRNQMKKKDFSALVHPPNFHIPPISELDIGLI